MGLRFKGAHELCVALEKKADLGQVKQIVRKHGAELQTKAMRNAPVDTGAMKRSISLEIQQGGLSAKIEPKAEYSAYVEYGTRYMEAKPFVGPAFNEQKEEFKRDLDKLVK